MRDKNQLFANKNRRKIFEYICAYPCTTQTHIFLALNGKYRQQHRYYLRKLEKCQYVKSYPESECRSIDSYYPTEMLRAADKVERENVPVLEIYACLNSASSRQPDVLAKPDEFFRFMYENQNESCLGLARKLDMPNSTLHCALKPFVKLGILNKSGPRNRTHCDLNLELLLEVVEYHEHRKEIFLNSIKGEILNPETKSNFRNVLVDSYELHLCVNPMKEYLERADLLNKITLL